MMNNTSDNFILEMRGISKSFAGVQALHNVSFQCRRGQIHGLVGENGAGKSTLMKILSGAYKPDSGAIIFKGQQHGYFSARQAMNSGISIIYQELALIPYMTVGENIFLGREPANAFGMLNTKRLYDQAAALLERLGIQLDLHLPVKELSIANQQMVEIAKALSQNADLIVMDEPSAILAGHELEQLFKIIQSLREQGVTVIYISHRLEEVFRIAQEVTVLKDGEVVGTEPIENLSRSKLVQMMVGRSLDEVFPATEHERGAAILVAEHLATGTILKDASFTLYAGEILGIAGMVGSGRTELARALFGADPLTAGTITVKGEVKHFNSPRQAIQAGLAFVPEERKTQGLFAALPIRNNITLTILKRITRYGILQPPIENKIVATIADQLSVVMASPEQEARFLSGGNQQKVVLAKWLETKPDIIILDEPTRGVDVGAKFEIYQLMRELNNQSVAIMMISSELTEILGMSDRILVMRDGQIVGEFLRGQASEEKIIELATSGQGQDNQ